MFGQRIKRGGGAVRRILPIATIGNQPGGMMNKYVPGSGVGATSVAVRRLKLYKAAPKTPSTPTVPVSTVPGAPTITSVSAGYQSATVVFSAPTNNGGQPITSYTVVSSPGGITVSGSSSPITVNGLTNGVSYTFTVVATNSIGSSAASNTSDVAVPNGVPPTRGLVQSAVSFYDNASLNYITFNNTFSRMCIDTNRNVIAIVYARSDTFTINKYDPDDGISQIQVLTDSFSGTTAITQGSYTYYTYNIEVIKYNTNGVPQWVAKIGGDTNKGNTIYDIVSDSANNVYALVGHATSIVSYYHADGSLFGTLNNTFSFGNFSPARYCLVKYNSSGQIQWVNTITSGDLNNAYVYLLPGPGYLTVDSNDNIYMTGQVRRAGGGSGPTTTKFYKYDSVNGSNEIQFTLSTTDSYPFSTDGQWQRGYLIKFQPNCNYDWIARMVIPGAYGEQNSGPTCKNMVVDSDNNIYVCIGSIIEASSPICNIYSGVSATSSPLAALASPYYRLDLRGNSLTPAAGQFYKFAAIAKFNSSGVFQRASCAHQLHNSSGSTSLDMNPFIGIDRITGSLYLSMNAQGFVGTNAMTGLQLNKLYINDFSDFSSNNTNGSNYDIIVSNAYNLTLSQPQTVVAIVQYDSSLQAQSMAYIDTPGGNYISPVVVDSESNVYITTTIKDNTSIKTIYTYDSLSGSDAVFNSFATINATNSNTDGLVVCYTGNLTNVLWAAPISSSDGFNDTGFITKIDSGDNIYVGGTALLDQTATTNTINLYNYDTVSSGSITNSLFGNMDVSNATDRAGFIVKYT